ncbi:rod shape-determining protein MreC [Candidatus Magnetobacterium bavaricum]|uniref:Cell shape-determining protein MreC n=1 Tax=Candidatus Magnetobacterium bavaricum TaxID=29290 RepID=A0A0F3GN55_9BACT|nr:rod shape-determining protein MreC [Candidatus Magnetobacterium bavaricum]
MSYQSIRGPVRPVFYLRYPVQYLNEAIYTIIKTIQEPFVTMIVVKQDNMRLKQELQQLLLRQETFKEQVQENNRLRQLLDIKDVTPGYVTTARVIGKNPSTWSQTMIINKGAMYGIKKDMAVRSSKCLIGKVILVDKHHSTVLLITDVHSSVAVKVQTSRLEGVVSGTGQSLCILKYIPQDEVVKEGDDLITSGYDSLYPPGIPVGRVSSVQRSQTEVFLNVEVTLCATPFKVDEVLVIDRTDSAITGP